MIKPRPKYHTDLHGTIYIDNIQQEMCASQNTPVYINYQTV
jgi:hypothetical protein